MITDKQNGFFKKGTTMRTNELLSINDNSTLAMYPYTGLRLLIVRTMMLTKLRKCAIWGTVNNLIRSLLGPA